jgi:hypothetical protein
VIFNKFSQQEISGSYVAVNIQSYLLTHHPPPYTSRSTSSPSSKYSSPASSPSSKATPHATSSYPQSHPHANSARILHSPGWAETSPHSPKAHRNSPIRTTVRLSAHPGAGNLSLHPLCHRTWRHKRRKRIHGSHRIRRWFVRRLRTSRCGAGSFRRDCSGRVGAVPDASEGYRSLGRREHGIQCSGLCHRAGDWRTRMCGLWR